MPYALERGDIPGAVVVVVKDGQILLQKGFGYADVAARKPVDGENTMFRPGSVSKLLTWTAVMQLVEQGKLDLDEDVNAYLDFKIPPRDGKPVTLRQVMTHTAGFEETARGLILDDPAALASIEESVKHWIPTRVYEGGTTPAYSNYATSLAGYIVQRVSGMSFDDYIERNIFAPLGMTRSTFRQPLPEKFKPYMSNGYKSGSDKAQAYELVGMAPAGSMAASGGDMGRFMIAHLNKGAYGSGRILQADTATKMHDTALTLLEPLHRMMLGFYEANINGHRVIAHAGDTQWFHSDLHLFLDDGVGLFVSFNSAGREGAVGPLRTALFEQFADRYMPGPIPEGKVDAATAKEHAGMIAGRYQNSRRSHTSFLSALNLAGQMKVVPGEDGTITVSGLKGLNGQPIKWREIAPFVWRDVAGADRLAARVEDGRVVRFGVEPFSAFMVFDRVPSWASSGWLTPALGAAFVVLLLSTLAWPIAALVRRRYGVAYGLSGNDARMHRLVRIAAALVLLGLLAGGVLIGMLMNDYSLMSASGDIWVRLVRIFALLAFVAGAVISVWNAWVVLRSNRRRLAKVWSVLLALSCLLVLYFGIVFRIVGFSANY
ncbi:serine hydrolase domain-containing protein [Luteimonas cucumeris]|nr:serine hydrolase domain-containing protein [Luteimonas cucumeris]